MFSVCMCALSRWLFVVGVACACCFVYVAVFVQHVSGSVVCLDDGVKVCGRLQRGLRAEGSREVRAPGPESAWVGHGCAGFLKVPRGRQRAQWRLSLWRGAGNRSPFPP